MGFTLVCLILFECAVLAVALANVVVVIIVYAVFWLDWEEDHPIGMVSDSFPSDLSVAGADWVNSSETLSFLASNLPSRRFLRPSP